jgi:hypothetical protein
MLKVIEPHPKSAVHLIDPLRIHPFQEFRTLLGVSDPLSIDDTDDNEDDLEAAAMKGIGLVLLISCANQ